MATLPPEKEQVNQRRGGNPTTYGDEKSNDGSVATTLPTQKEIDWANEDIIQPFIPTRTIGSTTVPYYVRLRRTMRDDLKEIATQGFRLQVSSHASRAVIESCD